MLYSYRLPASASSQSYRLVVLASLGFAKTSSPEGLAFVLLRSVALARVEAASPSACFRLNLGSGPI